MRLYDSYDLTDEEWNEVLAYPKEFKKGDIVENSSAGGSDKGHVWEVVKKLRPHGSDVVYLLKNLNSGQTGAATSSVINHIGTFIDDKTLEEVKPCYNLGS